MSEQRPDRPNNKRNRPTLANGGMKFGRGLMGWLLFVAAAILLFVYLKQAGTGATQSISISAFYQQVDTHNIEKVAIDGDELSGKLKEAKAINPGPAKVESFRVILPPGVSQNWEFTKDLVDRLGADG